MRIIELQPVPHAIVSWHDGRTVETLVLKLTFDLVDGGAAKLAGEQVDIVAHPAGPHEIPDRLPGKRGLELLVVGHAKCEVPLRVVPVRIALDAIDRRLFAHSEHGATELPLATAVRCLADPGSPPAFVGPGPVPPFRDGGQVLDLAAFNLAPSAQRLTALMPGALLQLEGLIGAGRPVATRLPEERPLALIRDEAGSSVRLELRCDTLLIDVDRATLALTWRTRLPSLGEATEVVIGVERADAPLSARDIAQRAARVSTSVPAPRRRATTQVIDGGAAQLLAESWPFERRSSRPPASGGGATERSLSFELGYTEVGSGVALERETHPPSSEERFGIRADLSVAPSALPRPSLPPPPALAAPLPVRPPNPLAEQGYGAGPAPSLRRETPPPDEPDEEPPPSSVPALEDAPLTVEDVTLELCAAITASLDLYPEHRDSLLDEERVSLEVWRRAERFWRQEITAAVIRADSELMVGFDRAYVARLERERGPIDLESYAELDLAIERGDVADVVIRLGIPRAAVIRIKRVWTRRLVTEPELRTSLREVMNRLRGVARAS